MTAITDTNLPRLVRPDEAFLTRKQVAGLLGDASDAHVDRLIAERKLESVREGRRVLVPVSSYRAYVARVMEQR